MDSCIAPSRRISAPARFAAALITTATLVACAPVAPPANEFTGWFHDFSTCRDDYAAMDARVAAAGVGDAAYYRVPGFPYLRTNRLLASFRGEVSGVNQVGGWIRSMREFDQEAREYEYVNLGMSIQEAAIQRFRFLNCGRALASLELDDPTGYARLISAVQPHDEYSSLSRLTRLYPLTVPFIRAQMLSERDTRLLEMNQPPEHGDKETAAPVLWTVKPKEDLTLVANAYTHIVPDELGLPGLVDSEWRALAEFHAPQLWIGTGTGFDQPASASLGSTGAEADASVPLVNYEITFTRFGGSVLAQISYFVWFKAADGDGGLDGLIWRVTLDDQGQALVYDSLHQSGRDHRWFPAQPLIPKPAGYWQDPPLIAAALAPSRTATLRLRAGTHELSRVVAAEQSGAGQARQYELRPYEDLFTLPVPNGGSRSLFDSEGRVRGNRLCASTGTIPSLRLVVPTSTIPSCSSRCSFHDHCPMHRSPCFRVKIEIPDSRPLVQLTAVLACLSMLYRSVESQETLLTA